jgi:hypothetical protein
VKQFAWSPSWVRAGILCDSGPVSNKNSVLWGIERNSIRRMVCACHAWSWAGLLNLVNTILAIKLISFGLWLWAPGVTAGLNFGA